MHFDTRMQLATMRDLLTRRLRELEAEVHVAEATKREAGRADRGEVVDRKEAAAQLEAVEVGTAEEQRDIDELRQVERALHRLDAGTYGDCNRCGQPIALDRLLVQPAAERCVACQAALESASRAKAG